MGRGASPKLTKKEIEASGGNFREITFCEKEIPSGVWQRTMCFFFRAYATSYVDSPKNRCVTKCVSLSKRKSTYRTPDDRAV